MFTCCAVRCATLDRRCYMIRCRKLDTHTLTIIPKAPPLALSKRGVDETISTVPHGALKGFHEHGIEAPEISIPKSLPIAPKAKRCMKCFVNDIPSDGASAIPIFARCAIYWEAALYSSWIRINPKKHAQIAAMYLYHVKMVLRSGHRGAVIFPVPAGTHVEGLLHGRWPTTLSHLSFVTMPSVKMTSDFVVSFSVTRSCTPKEDNFRIH